MFFRELKVIIGASAIAMILWPGFQATLPAGAVEKQSAAGLHVDASDEPRPGLKAKWEQDIDAPNQSEQADDAPIHPLTTPRVSNYLQRPTLTPAQKPVAGAPTALPAKSSQSVRQAKLENHSPAAGQPAVVTMKPVPAVGVVAKIAVKPAQQEAKPQQPNAESVEEAQRQADALKAAKAKADERIVEQKRREQQAALVAQQKLAQQSKQEALVKAAQERQRQQLAKEKAEQAQLAQEKERQRMHALAQAQEHALLKQKELEKQAAEKEKQQKQKLALAEKKRLLKQQDLELRAQEKALFLQRMHAQEERVAQLKRQALAQRAQAKAVQLEQRQLAQQKAQAHEREMKALALPKVQEQVAQAKQAVLIQLGQAKPMPQVIAKPATLSAQGGGKSAGVYMARSALSLPVKPEPQPLIASIFPNSPAQRLSSPSQPLRPVNVALSKTHGSGSATTQPSGLAMTSGHAQEQAARYARLLMEWLTSEQKQSLEPVLVQGQLAVEAILHEEGSLSAESLKIIGQQMHGYLLQTNHGLVVSPDPVYFAAQAKIHGLPADVAFITLMRQTLNGYWPVTMEQISGMSGCTRFGSRELVRLYGAWKSFQNAYPTAYQSLLKNPNLPLVSDIENQLLNSHSACDGPASVQDELQSFIAGYPNSDLTPKLKKRLGSFRRKSAGMVFYQGIQYAVDPNYRNLMLKYGVEQD